METCVLPCTLTNQTTAPTSGSRSHSPVQPVKGAVRPSAWYIFPTSEGTTNHVTGERKMEITSPRTPPMPFPEYAFTSSWVLETQESE